MKIQTASYREYFPKGTDFSTVSTEMLGKVEEELNKRPRKWSGYQTPAEVLALGKSTVAPRLNLPFSVTAGASAKY